jgi:hypothetical protein
MADDCIYTNRGKVLIEYQRMVPETALYNYPLFREYLVSQLAFDFAISLGKPAHEISDLKALSDEAFHSAAAMDAKGSPVSVTNYSSQIVKMRSYG